MKIGILTGGGDVPGLNACIKAATLRATEEAIGRRDPPRMGRAPRMRSRRPCLRGHQHRRPRRVGRPHDRPERRNDPAHLTDEPRAGPTLRGARIPALGGARRAGDHTPHVLGVLDRLGIDALIPIGGDDTLSFALRLHEEGVPVVAIPKTMDNDVHGTDYCIGSRRRSRAR